MQLMLPLFKKEWLKLAILLSSYLIILAIFKGSSFSNKFDKALIKSYLVSQDIPHEVVGRVFLSDGEIHTAAGYLYSKGEDPTAYNFQHPPLIKYLYGFSILLFGTPHIAQIALGVLLISILYFFGLRIFKNSLVPFLACVLLIIDPLFLDLTSQPLLDLGQAVFFLSYVFISLYYEDNFILQGVVLGLLSASKFWGASIFLISLFVIYRVNRKKFKVANFLLHLGIAGFIFSLIYARTFILNGFSFNIIFFQLKTLKYWLHHSVSSVPFASLLMFVSGYYKAWWGKRTVVRSDIWSPLWPLGLLACTYIARSLRSVKAINPKVLIATIPILYLVYLGVQAPFPRYFILILPFSYLILVETAKTIFVRMRKIE